jgi:hypothetical protein
MVGCGLSSAKMSPGDLFLGDGTSVRGTFVSASAVDSPHRGAILSTIHSMGRTEEQTTNHQLENAVMVPQECSNRLYSHVVSSGK